MSRRRSYAPTLRLIQSATDEFQLAASLRTNRKQRMRQRRFLVEGVRPINELLAQSWPIDSVWYAGGRPLSRWARAVLQQCAEVRRFELAPALMGQLSEKEETSELLAVVEMPDDDLGRIQVGPDALVVAFDRPVSPGNLGSVIRTANAFGAQGVITTGHGADIYEPQTIRASVGAVFALPVVRISSTMEIRRWISGLRNAIPSLQVIGSSAGADAIAGDADLTRPTLLVIGNETRGLSSGWKELCDEIVVIPMQGVVSSLNAAAAAAILLYELDRQRRA